MKKRLHMITLVFSILVLTAIGAHAWYVQEDDNDAVFAFKIGNLMEKAAEIKTDVPETPTVRDEQTEPEVEEIKPVEITGKEPTEEKAAEPKVSKKEPVAAPKATTAKPAAKAPVVSETPKVTYTTYTVKQGDTFWIISGKVGIPVPELLKINNMSENTVLYVGMTLQVPQYNIPPKSTPGPQYGELLDWWTEAQYVWPIGTNARVTDLATGKSFNVRRSYGAFHADCEPLTMADSAIMKEIWGGWTWTTRPVIVEVNGRRIAASSHAMPHSIQTITDNGFDGHFCIHFLNSTRHKDNLMQEDHQRNVRTAAGL